MAVIKAAITQLHTMTHMGLRTTTDGGGEMDDEANLATELFQYEDHGMRWVHSMKRVQPKWHKPIIARRAKGVKMAERRVTKVEVPME